MHRFNKQPGFNKRIVAGVTALTALLTASGAAFAASGAASPAPLFAAPQGHSGGLPQGRGGPQGRIGQPPAPSAATIPVEIMQEYLALSTDQVGQIRTITRTLRESSRPPRPERGGDGERPEPPGESEREAHRQVMDIASKKASEQVTALLTDTQKTKLAALLKGFEALRAARIPPFAIGQLKLTEAQWASLAALGTGATREGITALLTAAQVQTLESARPPGRGGRGGGDGMPPPPDGGGFPGGPPPPDDAGFPGGPPPPPGGGAY